jgi:hypothetical protein
VIAIILLGFIFSSYVNALYAFPNHSTSNSTTTKDNSTTSNTPSVLHMSSVPSNNGTLTSEPSTNTKDKSNAATGSNSEMFHTHHGTSIGTTGSSTGSGDQNTNSHDLAHKIINKIKQKLKVGDVPFP